MKPQKQRLGSDSVSSASSVLNLWYGSQDATQSSEAGRGGAQCRSRKQGRGSANTPVQLCYKPLIFQIIHSVQVSCLEASLQHEFHKVLGPGKIGVTERSGLAEEVGAACQFRKPSRRAVPPLLSQGP